MPLNRHNSTIYLAQLAAGRDSQIAYMMLTMENSIGLVNGKNGKALNSLIILVIEIVQSNEKIINCYNKDKDKCLKFLTL